MLHCYNKQPKHSISNASEDKKIIPQEYVDPVNEMNEKREDGVCE